MADGKGLFITLEGGEGSGKTTQIARLKSALEDKGRSVMTTREPGGTPEAEKIRALLVNRDGGDWTPEAECLLLYAARQMHVEKKIKPALAKGKIVISDRFSDSTFAYQGYGHGVKSAWIDALDWLALGPGFAPDLTFILDLPVETGLARAGKRLTENASAEDRFESLDTAFHERMRKGYLERAARKPGRYAVIDADKPPEDVANAILSRVKTLLAVE